MSYLYGDSTQSPLEVNFIELLRDGLDYAVHVLKAEERLRRGRERRRARERAAEQDLEQLETVGREVAQLVGTSGPGRPADSPAGRCAAAIAASAREAVKTETAAVRAALAADVAHLEGEAQRERDGCLQALETLLAKHDLPDQKPALLVHSEGGTRYAARLRGSTPWALDFVLELEIPAHNLFAHDVRVDRVKEHLEIHAPETAGWIRKEVRAVPHKLGKHHVTEVVVEPGATTIKLRSGYDAAATGFDVTVRPKAPRVALVRVGKEDGPGGAPVFDVRDEDATQLVALHDALAAAIAELRAGRRTLVQATLEGRPLRDDARPAPLVERLIRSLGPAVQEIARHSLTSSELVLRRLLGGDRREEIFVSRAELRRKIESAPDSMRDLFEPLGLIEDEAPTGIVDPLANRRLVASGSTPSVRPPPPPGAAPTEAEGELDAAWEPLIEDDGDDPVGKTLDELEKE